MQRKDGGRKWGCQIAVNEGHCHTDALGNLVGCDIGLMLRDDLANEMLRQAVEAALGSPDWIVEQVTDLTRGVVEDKLLRLRRCLTMVILCSTLLVGMPWHPRKVCRNMRTPWCLVYDDFFEIARKVMTDEHRSALRHLLNFRFKRHSRYNLPVQRLKLLEKMIQSRARKLLEG